MLRQEERRHEATERTRRWRAKYPEKYQAQKDRLRERYLSDSSYREQEQIRSREYGHDRYVNDAKWADNKRRTLRQSRRRKRAFLAEVVGAACVDCGDDRPGAVEYHHPGGKDKGQVPLTHLSWKKLEEEAMHLIALCGACHGVRHHKEHDG